MKDFDWWSVIERGLWTGLQAPAAVGVLDAISTEVSLTSLNYVWTALIALGVSVVKTLAQERLAFLDTRER